ncbi:MAG: hypothetical protein DWP95_02975 [Proteobacteria bacterium]|nr:MAG: hypothetical protein DWP95_02975 [Pseudomonadota bacterium]
MFLGFTLPLQAHAAQLHPWRRHSLFSAKRVQAATANMAYVIARATAFIHAIFYYVKTGIYSLPALDALSSLTLCLPIWVRKRETIIHF